MLYVSYVCEQICWKSDCHTSKDTSSILLGTDTDNKCIFRACIYVHATVQHLYLQKFKAVPQTLNIFELKPKLLTANTIKYRIHV